MQYDGHIYSQRRYVVFNLYAFDNSRASNPSYVPELKIDNCDFSFFLVGMESLINIETNNYS